MVLNESLLKQLAETPGAPGREEHVRAIVREELAALTDEMRTDPLGNVIGTKRGRPDVRVMIAAHMDEVGFLVKWIDHDGFLRLQPLGYYDLSFLLAQRVLVSTSSGATLRGVLQATRTPPVPRSLTEPRPPLAFDDLYLDLGLSAETVTASVEVGDPVTMDRTCERLGDTFVGKALDDRVGLFVMLEALRVLRSYECTIHAVATVQEEIGRTPGAAASGSILQPTVVLAVDSANARDVPGAGGEHTQTALGRGPGLKIRDMGALSHPRLLRHVRSIAEREGIPYHLEINPWGATDISAVQLLHGGIPAMTLSIPTRYVHTPNEMVHAADVQACIDLLARFLEEAHLGDYAL